MAETPSDYTKRKHVLRLVTRNAGQFLLQFKDDVARDNWLSHLREPSPTALVEFGPNAEGVLDLSVHIKGTTVGCQVSNGADGNSSHVFYFFLLHPSCWSCLDAAPPKKALVIGPKGSGKSTFVNQFVADEQVTESQELCWSSAFSLEVNEADPGSSSWAALFSSEHSQTDIIFFVADSTEADLREARESFRTILRESLSVSLRPSMASMGGGWRAHSAQSHLFLVAPAVSLQNWRRSAMRYLSLC